MQKLLMLAALAVVGLGYLAVNPSPVARALFTSPHAPRYTSEKDWYDDAQRGVEARDPHWMLNMGIAHWWGTYLPEGVEPDPLFGRELILRSMEAGHAHAATMYYYFVDKTRDGARLAAEYGSPIGVLYVAYEEAHSWCESGALPEGTMDRVYARYAQRLDPENSLRYIPKDVVAKAETSIRESYTRTRTNILVDIPAHFDAVCTDSESFERMFGLNRAL